MDITTWIKLKKLHENEPKSNIFYRMAIINYELGDVNRDLVYERRFKEKNTYKAHIKLSLSDLITQIHILCIDLDIPFNELEFMGVQHLEERFNDFKKKEWKEIKDD